MQASHDSYDIREVHPDALKAPGTNPNRMSDETYAMLVEAIRRVGFLQPVLAQEDADGSLVIVDGYHRVKAAREVGLTNVPVIVGDFQDDPGMAHAVQIGMNRMRGELDLAAVAQQVSALATSGWNMEDLELTGFSKSELEDLLATTRHRDEEVLEGGLGGAPNSEPEAEEGAAKPFILELTFAKKADLSKAKRGLKKAAGKGRELADGLLRLLDGA